MEMKTILESVWGAAIEGAFILEMRRLSCWQSDASE